MSNELKYVRLKQFDSFIFFPTIVEHSKFRHLDIESAGFCLIYEDSVKCYRKSISLDIHSKEDDSELATRQLYSVQYY